MYVTWKNSFPLHAWILVIVLLVMNLSMVQFSLLAFQQSEDRRLEYPICGGLFPPCEKIDPCLPPSCNKNECILCRMPDETVSWLLVLPLWTGGSAVGICSLICLWWRDEMVKSDSSEKRVELTNPVLSNSKSGDMIMMEEDSSEVGGYCMAALPGISVGFACFCLSLEFKVLSRVAAFSMMENTEIVSIFEFKGIAILIWFVRTAWNVGTGWIAGPVAGVGYIMMRNRRKVPFLLWKIVLVLICGPVVGVVVLVEIVYHGFKNGENAVFRGISSKKWTICLVLVSMLTVVGVIILLMMLLYLLLIIFFWFVFSQPYGYKSYESIMI